MRAEAKMHKQGRGGRDTEWRRLRVGKDKEEW